MFQKNAEIYVYKYAYTYYVILNEMTDILYE